MTTYCLTVRPAWPENVPAGYVTLEPGPGEHGTVSYPEPLARETSRRYSLVPAKLADVPRVLWGTTTYRLGELGPELEALSWDLAEEIVDEAAFERALYAIVADFGIPAEEIELIWPTTTFAGAP
jgi:hypothetical protein